MTSSSPATSLVAQGNPILENLEAADPHVLLHGHRYFLYATVAGKTEPGFAVWSSPDLQSWQYEGMALCMSEVSWAKERDWAPAIIERNGRFYLYFCGEDQIGVAVADSPVGPFEDCLNAPLVPYLPDTSSIDPMAFTDDDGKSFLYWGAVPGYWLEEPLKAQGFDLKMGLSVAPLNPDLISFAGPEQTTVSIERWGEAWHAFDHMEAQFVLKRRGIYYLMWSRGSYGRFEDDMAYHLVYATSNSPLGPWKRNGDRPVLSNRADIEVFAPGHHSILQRPGTDEWLCFYHFHRAAKTWRDGVEFDPIRSLAIDRMRFDEQGEILPIVPTTEGVGATPIPLALQMDARGPIRVGETRTLRATCLEPVVEWQFFAGETLLGSQRVLQMDREPTTGTHALCPQERGFLRLWARAQTFDGRTLQSAPIDFDVEQG